MNALFSFRKELKHNGLHSKCFEIGLLNDYKYCIDKNIKV